MRNRFGIGLVVGMLCAAGAAFGQTPAADQRPANSPVFDVASVRPAATPDMARVIADLQAGKKPESIHLDGSRATLTYMSLKELIAYAYRLQLYEVNAPEWAVKDRFDISARIPDGASKDDVPEMMKALLEDRFKLAAHRETIEQPVLGLVVGRSGPKLKESAAVVQPIDPTAPLRPGESQRDTVAGPMRLMRNEDGSTTYNMGLRGSFTLRFDGETRSMHMQAHTITMNGFATMMTSLGVGEGRQIVDMTGLTGKYQAAVDVGLMDLLGSLHDSGIDLPTGPRGGDGASDPEGGVTVAAALDKLGLKLQKSRAQVARLVVDHVEKDATEN